ncbi:Glycine betaine/L-proline transport system permease protein proW [Ewingella americana]|uniref:Glycine betaine/L-proline transport system permease protein proW n=1 Tax=Ewingella americana TaxID=41202 RepID=A0A377NCQ8_9GAMM|nr:Glycine betaine/L-proline transport system permease protein proW [Ewingella americana]
MSIIIETWHWFLQADHWSGDLGIWQRFGQHLYYVLVSLLIAVLIAQPLGILFGYWKRGGFLVINLFNIGQAFPSLGIILLCIMLFGFTDVPVFIALVALAIPPMLTNTYVGISNADQTLCDAAKAMGMTPLQSLLQVRIPLAMPLIFAGIRTSLLQLIAHGGGRRLRRAGRAGAFSDRRAGPARFSSSRGRFIGDFAAGDCLRAADVAGRQTLAAFFDV